jgi:hypothetical protein
MEFYSQVIKGSITARGGNSACVLKDQQWDKSVRENLTSTDDDWEQLREMERFFNLFYKPTIYSTRYPS